MLRVFFEEKLLRNQQLFSSEERYQRILEVIPDECEYADQFIMASFFFFLFHNF